MKAKPEIDFPAVLLAGGFGTRLRGVLPDLPKPLAPVRGRPFLAYLLDQVEAAGWTRAILCLHYKSEQIIQAMGDRHGALQIEYSVEPEPLGTGGAVRLALAKVNAPRFLLQNADSFCAAPLAEFAAFHLAHGRPASILSVRVPNAARYGRLEMNPDGRVRAFTEKGASGGAGSINAGVYILESELAKTIPVGRPVSLESEMFPAWLPQGLTAWETSSAFIDIGTPESYLQVERYLHGGETPV
jgi:D-glycero-alpha-D-manno-heptose 1-phosphate guanylyltransferase